MLLVTAVDAALGESRLNPSAADSIIVLAQPPGRVARVSLPSMFMSTPNINIAPRIVQGRANLHLYSSGNQDRGSNELL